MTYRSYKPIRIIRFRLLRRTVRLRFKGLAMKGWYHVAPPRRHRSRVILRILTWSDSRMGSKSRIRLKRAQYLKQVGLEYPEVQVVDIVVRIR